MDFFTDWQEFDAAGATVKFYKKSQGSVEYIGFDSRKCVPPEPMVNALVALNFVKDETKKVVMVNHKFPMGLIPKIESKFDIAREDLDGDAVKLTISLKPGAVNEGFDTDAKCHG